MSRRGEWRSENRSGEGGDRWEAGELRAERGSHVRSERSQTQDGGGGDGLDPAPPRDSEREQRTGVLPKTGAAAGTVTKHHCSWRSLLEQLLMGLYTEDQISALLTHKQSQL